MGPSDRVMQANQHHHVIDWWQQMRTLTSFSDVYSLSTMKTPLANHAFCSRCCFDDPYSCSVTSRQYFRHTAGRQTSVMPHPHQQMAAHPQIPACVRLMERDSCSFHGFAGSFFFFMFTFTNMYCYYKLDMCIQSVCSI